MRFTSGRSPAPSGLAVRLLDEVVEAHTGRNRDQQTERRRHQGFRNTAGHSADTRGLLRRDLLEGVQNADDGSEQADERCGRTDRRQAAEALLQLRVNDRLRALESALGALNLLLGDRAARTERTELSETSGDNLCQVRLLRAVG